MLEKYLYSIFILVFVFNLPTFTESDKNKKNLQKQNFEIHQNIFNINNISTYVRNNGGADLAPRGNSGFTFPKGSKKTAIYESGLVWGGKINEVIRVGGSTYNHGLRPGKILSDGTPENYKKASVRVYRVRPDYKSADLTSEINDGEGTEKEIRNRYKTDWNEWPTIDGAPFDDLDNDGIYNPQIDIPGVQGADQTLWYVANDRDSNLTKELYGSLPMGIEMQVTIWGYTDRGVYNNMLFKKYKLINKSNSVFDSVYVSIWSDPDLGDVGDDFVGCDTLLNMDYVYNGNKIDRVYQETPPSVGFALLQGPKGYNGNNLEMTSFHYVSKHGDENYHPPRLRDYNGSLKYYKFMQGKIGDGSLFPIPDIFGGGTTKFPFSGDPISRTGFIEDIIRKPGDRLMAIGSGPFSIAIGDTQEIVFAEVAAQGEDNINSIRLLKYYVEQIPKNYDSIKFIEKYHVPIPPPPEFSFNEYLDPNKISFIIKDNDNIVDFENNGYKFQGYNVYQLKKNFFDGKYYSFVSNLFFKIATYDIKDGVTKIYDYAINTQTGKIIKELAQNGTDSGISEIITIDHDFATNTSLIKGKRYDYAITVYYYNPNSGKYPSTVESLIKSKSIVFQNDIEGVSYKDTLKVDSSSVTNSDVFVFPLVANPSQLTDHTYRVSLHNNKGISYWNLTDITLNKVILKNQKVLGKEHYWLENRLLKFSHEIPKIDGMLIIVTRKEYTLGDFKKRGIYLTKYEGKPTSFYRYETGDIWTYTGVKKKGWDRFSVKSAISNKIKDIYIDAKYLLPYDYELRFTDNENFAIDYWNNHKIISVPFELWNIGINTPSDSSDDIRMVPFVKMLKDTNYWSINSKVDIGEISFSQYYIQTSDWIYWMKPDVKSGGYNSFAKICNSIGIGRTYDTTADKSRQGFYVDFQGGFNYVMGNMTIRDEDKDGNPPPSGTTIRFSTLKPIPESNTFTFSGIKPFPRIIPDKNILFQNFPNPFNPTTTIRFSIREDGKVKLTIFNILGQKIKELINEKMLAGKYEVPFDGSNFASGIYFYRIDNGQFVETHKMVLLK